MERDFRIDHQGLKIEGPVLKVDHIHPNLSIRVNSRGRALMRMPCAAATPEPTITAVGVARPKAQGQAITSVLMLKSRAKRKALLPAGYQSCGNASCLPAASVLPVMWILSECRQA